MLRPKKRVRLTEDLGTNVVKFLESKGYYQVSLAMYQNKNDNTIIKQSAIKINNKYCKIWQLFEYKNGEKKIYFQDKLLVNIKNYIKGNYNATNIKA